MEKDQGRVLRCCGRVVDLHSHYNTGSLDVFIAVESDTVMRIGYLTKYIEHLAKYSVTLFQEQYRIEIESRFARNWTDYHKLLDYSADLRE